MSDIKVISTTQRIVVDPATFSISVINAGPQGPPGGGEGGGGGTAVATEVRSDWVSPYNYIGVAPADTLDSATGWTISRLEVESDGSVTETNAYPAIWNNRLTEVYT